MNTFSEFLERCGITHEEFHKLPDERRGNLLAMWEAGKHPMGPEVMMEVKAAYRDLEAQA